MGVRLLVSFDPTTHGESIFVEDPQSGTIGLMSIRGLWRFDSSYSSEFLIDYFLHSKESLSLSWRGGSGGGVGSRLTLP